MECRISLLRIIEIQVEPPRCAECEASANTSETDHEFYEPDGAFVCLECRYAALHRKYRRLRKAFNVLQRAFAEIKFALLTIKGNRRSETILGICEAYRGKFDAKFD